MMEKKIMIFSLVLFLVISSSLMENAVSQGVDCFDSCSTGCVNRDTRLMQRCEGKCRIKCGPDLEEVKEHLR